MIATKKRTKFLESDVGVDRTYLNESEKRFLEKQRMWKKPRKNWIGRQRPNRQDFMDIKFLKENFEETKICEKCNGPYCNKKGHAMICPGDIDTFYFYCNECSMVCDNYWSHDCNVKYDIKDVTVSINDF